MCNSFIITAKGKDATIVVRVGNNRPDLGVNPVCNRFTGSLEEGRPLFLPCNPPMPGAFVSVHFEVKLNIITLLQFFWKYLWLEIVNFI